MHTYVSTYVRKRRAARTLLTHARTYVATWPKMPTRKEKLVAAKVWMVHGKPNCKSYVSAGKDPQLSGFGGRLREAAEKDDEVTLHCRDGISYLTFNKACKWDKAARWAQGAMGNCKIKLTVRPAPQLDQLQVDCRRID